MEKEKWYKKLFKATGLKKFMSHFGRANTEVGFLEEKKGHKSFMRLLLLLFSLATIGAMLFMVYKDNIDDTLIIGMTTLILTGKVTQKYFAESKKDEPIKDQAPPKQSDIPPIESQDGEEQEK